MSRIAIVGVGAIGGVVAGLRETAAAHEITLCTRRPLPGAFTVETPEGIVTVHARNVTGPAQCEPVDWILCATKTYHAAEAAKWFPALTGPATRLAVIQNGVEHRENFAGLFAPERILPIVIDVPAERRSDTDILQRTGATLRVEDTADGRAFAQLFAGTKANLDVTGDFFTAAWTKLSLNSCGVISALTLQPAGILRDEALGEVALGIIAECVAVGRAEGARLPDGLGERILAHARAGSPHSVNSLLADRIAHRQTEIEARNGVIIRRGEKHGIPTPLNRMAVALFHAMVSPPQFV
jgi:2-dehydropantoate 2-reductase